jgi:clan AA aspartic protease (TIGR02281 family)
MSLKNYLNNNMKKYIISLVLVLPLLGFSQCKKEQKSFEGYGDYFGCLNDNEQPDGKGKMTFVEGGSYDGNWSNGNMQGIGIYVQDNGLIYNGNFENNNFTGNGTLTQKSSDYEIIQTGLFNNGTLILGKKTTIQSNGLVVDVNIENGSVISERRNDRNYYKASDIVSNISSTIVSTVREDDKYFVTLKVNSVIGEWYFDTGADGISIGKRLFDRLVDSGIKYRNLKMNVTSFGVGGSSENKYIILDEITIGEITVKNVVATVRLEQNYSLLGVQFFDKFSNVEWDMKAETLKLYK